MPQPTPVRFVIAAAAAVVLLAYLAGAARGIGSGDRDVVFSPSVDAPAQLNAGASSVPVGGSTTLSALVARGSLAVALGRRSAIRDFAAVSTALAAATFGAILYSAGCPAIVAIVAMLGISFGDTFWWRGITYTADTMFPLLFLLSIWTALRWQVTRRRAMALLSVISGVFAIVDFVRPMASGSFTRPAGPGFMSALAAEFTPLGVFLVMLGLVVLLRSRATRLQAALVAVVLLTWHALWRSPLDPIGVVVVMGGWLAIAIALAWLHSSASSRSRSLIVGAIAVVLIATPVATRWRVYALGGDLPSERRARAAADFPIADLPDDVAVVAESRRADAALLLSARLAGKPITILPQSVDAVAEAMRRGRPIIAFENAGANLERYGFLFERTLVGNVAVAAVAGRVPCAPITDGAWTDVSLLAANGSIIIHGAPNAGPAGTVIRMAAATPIRVAAADPDVSIATEDVARDAAGVAELLEVADRDAAASISSVRVGATNTASPVTVTFASPPAYAVAIAEGVSAKSICPGVQRSGVMLGAGPTAAAAVNMNDNAPFVSGWHPVEADPDLFRWTAAADASLRLSVARPGRVRITITATPASRPEQNPTIGLTVNSCRLDVRAMQAGQGDYDWTVDERCWRPGVNQLWIHTSPLISPSSLFTSHDTRLLGSRIGAIRLASVPTP